MERHDIFAMNSKAQTLQGFTEIDHRKRSAPPSALTSWQLVRVVIFAVAYWFAAAMLIKATPQIGLFGGATGIFTFLVMFPVAWISVVALRWIANLRAGQIFSGMSFGTGVAALCDGIALTWGPELYGGASAHTLLGSASILWGVGTLLLTAYFVEIREWSRRVSQ
jgi:hypothetical protein